MSAILRIRTELFGVSQAEMARIAGVTQPTVSRWEAGTYSPTLEEVARIRSVAKERRLKWSDKLLFEVKASDSKTAPATPAPAATSGAAV